RPYPVKLATGFLLLDSLCGGVVDVVTLLPHDLKTVAGRLLVKYDKTAVPIYIRVVAGDIDCRIDAGKRPGRRILGPRDLQDSPLRQRTRSGMEFLILPKELLQGHQTPVGLRHHPASALVLTFIEARKIIAGSLDRIPPLAL